MKKQNREVYRELVGVVDFSLCSFCKYAECYGSCCNADAVELECHHPLDYRLPFYEELLEPTADCWGFRPSKPISFIADIVGIILIHGWSVASWWENKKGIWKVAGIA